MGKKSVKRKTASKRKTTSTPQRRATVSEQIERELVASAMRKRSEGVAPNDKELAAVRRYEKAREEEQRWAYYRTIPKRHWRQMSGRQNRTINEQAKAYGIPFGGRTIDLPAVVAALHDFLSRNARKLVADNVGDPMLQGPSSPAMERYRAAAAELKELDLAERHQALLPRESVRQGLAIVSNIIRAAGDTLQRRCGKEAYAILTEALQDAEEEIIRRFGQEHDGDSRKKISKNREKN